MALPVITLAQSAGQPNNDPTEIVMSIKSLTIASLTLLASVAGIAGAAQAGGGHHGHGGHHGGGHHNFHHHGFKLVIGGNHGRDCSFYREMWEETGSFRWKRRYFACKGF